MGFRLIIVNIGNRARLDAIGMVNQVFRICAELTIQGFGRQLRHPIQVINTIFFQSPCNARPNVPNVRYWPMMPQVFPERFRIQVSDMVGDFLGRDVQRNLGQEQVRTNAGGGAYARLGPHRIHQHYRHFFGRPFIHFQVRRDIDKAFVNGIDMDVFGRDIAQINPVNLDRYLHILFHAGRGGDVFDPTRDFKDPATIANPQGLHRRRYRQTNRTPPP